MIFPAHWFFRSRLVALEMGNSPKVVKDHYFAPVFRSDSAGFYRSVARAAVTRSLRGAPDAAGWVGGRCARSLACRGGSRLRRAGTRHQHQDENGKGRTKYDCSFHNVNCFFNKRFFGLAGYDHFAPAGRSLL
jgi:hypothetical protein